MIEIVILLVCLLVAAIIIIAKQKGQISNKVYEDSITLEKNRQIQEENNKLNIECSSLAAKRDRLKESQVELLNTQSNIHKAIDILEKQQSKELEQLKELSNQKTKASQDLQNIITKSNQMADEMKSRSKKAYAEYCEVLVNSYEEKENEYNKSLKLLDESYTNRQLKLMDEIAAISADLEKIKATREASIQAALREQEIKDDLSFYCLELDEIDQADIITLETIKPRLSKPRVLSMLIWQTFYQKPLKSLSARVLGESIVTGIYKITNTKTEQSYIGQSVDIAKRWSEHAKCGLGIDTPANNKLYKAMKENGLTSFSWELLERCSRDQLDEKEKFYIELYHADNYGYNSTKGNSR